MNLYRAGVGLLLALVLGAVVHIAVYYPALPPVVASHFGMDGKVNDTMSRDAFMAVYAGAVALLTAIFLGIGLVLPSMPDSSINIPNKEFWLAKERRAETLNTMATYMVWIGALSMLFTIGTIHVTFLYQLHQITNINGIFYPMFGVFFVCLLVWITLLLKRFKAPAV